MSTALEGPVDVLRVRLTRHEAVRMDDHNQPAVVGRGEV